MNEHKNIITVEDEIKEFSDKPVKSCALFRRFANTDSSIGDVESATKPFNLCLKVGDGTCELVLRKQPYKTPCTPAIFKEAMQTANLDIIGTPVGSNNGFHYTVNQWIITSSGTLQPTYSYLLVLSTIDYSSSSPILSVAKLSSSDDDTQLTGTISYYTLTPST